MRRVSPDERKLRKELQKTLRTLESWESWSLQEALDRCLRWLGEGEEAAEQVRVAAQNRPVGESPVGHRLVYAGNLDLLQSGCLGDPLGRLRDPGLRTG